MTDAPDLFARYPVERLAAFSHGALGGNPAGVVLLKELPPAEVMQALARQVGYSETAFAAPQGQGWRVRYFAPEIEVPFCGHATIALGAALAGHYGDGIFALKLNASEITVEGHKGASGLSAALQSPPTHSEPAPPELVAESLALFGYSAADLDPRLPPALANGGAQHLVLALRERTRLACLEYDLETGRKLMLLHGFATIALVHAETSQLFHARNPFAAGGVYEDPATGAAAAALAGYLRDISWPHGGKISIHQGDDMGVPCRLTAEISPEPGASIRVSGNARLLG